MLLAFGGVATLTGSGQPAPDLRALLGGVRDNIRREYTAPLEFTYLEKRRDVDISKLGAVSIGPLRTFEVYPSNTSGDTYKRLIAIDGRPLGADELAKRDAEHQRNLRRRAERERAESPRQRATRLEKEAAEATERAQILDDAYAVYQPAFAGRDTLDGQDVVVVTLNPKPEAAVRSREGRWMKSTKGTLWIDERDREVVRARIDAVDDLSIGWGMVARIHPGSGFEYARKKFQGAWLPSVFTVRATGRTLLFRKFQFETVTTYTDHKRLGS